MMPVTRVFAVTLVASAAMLVQACAGERPMSRVGDPGTVETSASASPSPSASPSAVPVEVVIETKTITETVSIPFPKTTRDDPDLESGKRVVATRGVAGSKTLTYEITLTGGVETARKLVKEVVTKDPVTEVTRVGTKPKSNCHPSYSGACVPFASDVDCEGGAGNGPAYVRGPFRVVGEDVYGLDADNDGIACE